MYHKLLRQVPINRSSSNSKYPAALSVWRPKIQKWAIYILTSRAFATPLDKFVVLPRFSGVFRGQWVIPPFDGTAKFFA